MKRTVLWCVFTTCACSDGLHDSATALELREDGLIYDSDSRCDVMDCASQEFAEIALHSTVAIVSRSKLSIAAGEVEYNQPTLRESLEFCDGELRFEKQPTLADCSGVLIGPDLVLTGGHCVDDQAQCEQNYFVFGYAMLEDGMRKLTANDLFECRELVSRELSDMDSFGSYDHAVVRLDRAVDETRRPVAISSKAVAVGESVILVGNGAGLPTKIDLDGRVVDGRATHGDYFTAQIDNFERGSGSPVFNANGHLTGIAVRGGVDYDTRDLCFRLRRVEGSLGLSEHVSYAHAALQRVQAAIGYDLPLVFSAANADDARQRGGLSREAPGCRVGHERGIPQSPLWAIPVIAALIARGQSRDRRMA